MKIVNTAGSPNTPASCEKPDAIKIMRQAFSPEELGMLLERLEAEGHRCEVFDDLEAAFGDARTKLLLLGATEESWNDLIESVRSDAHNLHGAPILVYFKGTPGGVCKEMLIPEIDDFLLAPLNLQDVHLRIKRLTRQFEARHDEAEQARMNLLSQFGLRQFIGHSPAFLAAVEKIPRIAACDATVLLIGDTGTGKEMCAHAIHYLSPRANKSFVPVNCGSIPPELFENEMFGHEPGAYTDARKSRRGLIAEAEGGTLFLDEVDSLPMSAQVKLLRFLQDGQYRPLGASQSRKADIRLLAASNKNLYQKVQEGTFREDLYYRLHVVSLVLPPLCERPGDILLLATHFLKKMAKEYDRPVSRFSHDAEQKLLSYPWPGNVRELENTIRQAIILSNGTTLRSHNLQTSNKLQMPIVSTKESFKVAKARVVEEFERSYLSEMVAAHGGNISRAARGAQKDRRVFFALLKKHGLTTNYPGRFKE